MPIYLVRQAMTAAIQANTASDAIKIAEAHAAQIVEDVCPEVEAVVRVHTLSQLSGGWSGEDLPYGGNGRTALKDLLPGL